MRERRQPGSKVLDEIGTGTGNWALGRNSPKSGHADSGPDQSGTSRLLSVASVNSQLVGYDPWFDGFTRGGILEFAGVGLYPPPLIGNPRNPESVLFGLAAQERWRDPPPLRGTDQEGVEKQRRDFEEDVQQGLALMQGRDLATWGCYHDPHGDRTDPTWLARQRAVFACVEATDWDEKMRHWNEAERLRDLIPQPRLRHRHCPAIGYR